MGLRHPISRLAGWLAGRMPPQALQAMYRLGPVTRLLRGALNRSVPDGLVEVEVAGGRMAGARLLLDLRFEKDYWLGSYEPSVLEALGRLLLPGMTVYDVGAHIGYLTLYLARLVGPDGRVVAFEPLPANQERLRSHLALNGVQERVQLIPAAVGETAGRQRFQPHASVAMGRLISGEADGESVLEVEVVSLDRFCAAAGATPDLVKIDVEGEEAAVLRGMRETLRRAKPTLIIEVHNREAASATARELQDAGYSLHRLVRGFPTVGSLATLQRRDHVLAMPQEATRSEGAP